MAAFNFPNSPSTNELHTENGVTYKWNGTVWKRQNTSYTDATNLNVTGISTLGGNVSIGGVLTYEDVKNVDSVGIISARTAIHVGAGISAVGIITGTSFRGDGSQLTGITQVGGATTVGFDDNKPIYFGSQDDYKMVWSGTQMTFEPTSSSTTQQLYLTSNNQMYINSKASGLFLMSGNQYVIDIYGGVGGGVYFKHNNSQKLKLEGGNWTYLNGATVTHAGDVFIPDKIVHAGDTNTAIRFPSADTISFETAGSERLNIASNGDVTITNTSSNPQLALISANDGISEIQFGDGNDSVRGNILYRSGSAGDALCFNGYNNTERLRIDSSGNIGINENSPTGKLHISHTNGAGIFVDDSSNSSNSPYIQVLGKRSDGNVHQSFTGQIFLSSLRTDQKVASSKQLGTVLFGGNHTDGTEANILYAASIAGVADDNFDSATDMPSDLEFYTGDSGISVSYTHLTLPTKRIV